MKMKLCSLKYAPYTAVATVEKVSRIWFMPNTSSEPTHCIRIDGKAAGRWDCGIRLVTDEDGKILRTVSIESGAETE